MIKPKGSWKEFKGQPLMTGDILMMKSGNLSFVGSKYTTKEPSTIETIHAVTREKDCYYSFDNGSINNRKRIGGDMYIGNSGWIMRGTDFVKELGPRIDRILFVYRLKK